MTIELFESRVDGVSSCLGSIFEPPVWSRPPRADMMAHVSARPHLGRYRRDHKAHFSLR